MKLLTVHVSFLFLAVLPFLETSPINQLDGEFDSLASTLIEALVEEDADVDGLEDALVAKRQEEQMANESSIVKRQLRDNMTLEGEIKRGDLLSVEVLDVATRQLEEALANETVSMGVMKRQLVENQV